MVVITVPWRTPLRRIEGEEGRVCAEGERARAFGLTKACPLSYAIPRGAGKDWEGISKRGRH